MKKIELLYKLETLCSYFNFYNKNLTKAQEEKIEEIKDTVKELLDEYLEEK